MCEGGRENEGEWFEMICMFWVQNGARDAMPMSGDPVYPTRTVVVDTAFYEHGAMTVSTTLIPGLALQTGISARKQDGDTNLTSDEGFGIPLRGDRGCLPRWYLSRFI